MIIGVLIILQTGTLLPGTVVEQLNKKNTTTTSTTVHLLLLPASTIP